MIAALTIIVAVVGVLLTLTLLRLLAGARDRTRLGKHRSRGEGAADLLNYAALVQDGIVVGKDGSLMAGWRYQCPDTASSTEAEQEHLAAQLNRALAPLGGGWMVHVDAVREPADQDAARSEFPDPVTAAIEAERREFFARRGTVYEGYFVLTVTYLPPALAQSKFVEVMFEDDRPARGARAHSEHLVGVFNRDIKALEARLPIKLERLRARDAYTEYGAVRQDDFLRWLHYCVTGLSHPIALPSNAAYLDLLIGGQDLWGGVVPKIGKKFIQVVAIEGFPLESRPAMLVALAELPCEYRWSTRFIFLDRHEAVRSLESYRRKWRQKIRGIVDQVLQTQSGAFDHDAVGMVADADAALSEVNSGLVAQGFYTSVVVLMDESRERVTRAAEQTYRVITRLGFSAARIEDVNTLEAYLGSLPGHGVQNVRRPLLNTLNLADLLPSSTIWAGEHFAPCPYYPPESPRLLECLTGGCTPFRLNLHVGDVGHTLMFGPTGSGKSTHLALLAAQLRRYPGMRIFAFDNGKSLYPLVSAIAGSTQGRSGLHFELAAEGALSFAPLQFLETRSDRAWAMEWVDIMLGLGGLQTTGSQRNEIALAVLNMHETGARSLTELVLTLQDADMRAALEQYTVRGSMGHLLDARDDALELSDFTVFEVEELMSLGDRFALPVLWYLFRRIERSLRGQPAAILLDEAWVMLGHPVFREKIRQWLKVLRKSNCLVLLATQSLSDASRSGILDVLSESCATKIFLPNPNAREESASALYRGMGLNARQIDILASATPKKHYYYVSSEGRRLYELALGPVALAFCGASGKEDLEQISKLQRDRGDHWVESWLQARGVRRSGLGVAA
ncbi:MAG TPA: conjugal transfer protein TrbE [Polyangiaceae bacterium]|nr:conjugal transfer protein TrbE [Polyangiaceae bacterium]